MIGLLLRNKSPLDAADSDGQTALHHAVAEGHGDAAVALLKAGAAADRKDANGDLALDLAPDKDVSRALPGRGDVHPWCLLLPFDGWECSLDTGSEIHRADGRERRYRAVMQQMLPYNR